MKSSEQRAIERLFRRRVLREEIASLDLIRELAELSRQLERRLGLLIDRGGAVTHVFVGTASVIDLPRLDSARRGTGRLKGLRWITTILSGGDPSPRDLDALVRARLDLLLVVSAGPEGEVEGVRTVHLVPAAADGSHAYEVGPQQADHQLRQDLLPFLEELEDAFEAASPGGLATGEGQRRPVVLGVVTTGPKRLLGEELDELRALAEAAGLEVKGELCQRREQVDPHTLLGRGRVSDLGALALRAGAELVVINADLAPRQQVALEDELGIKVIDRTQLILDIFAQRARTHAGKLQVEAARLRHELPRLIGRGGELSRVGGGKGKAGGGRTKGAGEKKLEIDRRRVRDRIGQLERQLEHLRRQGELRRDRRRKNRLPMIALVGYTNVGKSTLFNRITDARVLAEDRLFASLDPTLRQRKLPGGRRVILSDTVGFVRRLPAGLVEAFRATLDELKDAVLLLHVADASDPHALERVEAVRKLLAELGTGQVRELLVWNKLDRLEDPAAFVPLARTVGSDPILISAATGDLEPLVARIEAILDELLPRADQLERSDEALSTAELEALQGEVEGSSAELPAFGS